MTIKQALLWADKKLNKSDSPQLDAEVLLGFVLKQNKTYLFTYLEKNLTKKQVIKFKKLINKRKKIYPIAYLVNTKEFYGNNFYVDRHVLIPRPETEMLIEQANDLINKYKTNTIADIGTGSGCIAISLKKLHPKLNVYASDISLAALKIAKKNSYRNKTKINFIKGDLLTPYQHKKIDLFIANLPYVSHKIYKQSPSIQAEPKKALFAKNYGLQYIKTTLNTIQKLTYKPKFLLLEISPEQYSKIKKILTSQKIKVQPYKDLQKKIRTLKITLH